MDEKLSFNFNWIPLARKIALKRHGLYAVSPCFLTVYKRVSMKWRIIFFPNGEQMSNSDEIKCSVIYLQLINGPNKNHCRIDADIDIELISVCNILIFNL